MMVFAALVFHVPNIARFNVTGFAIGAEIYPRRSAWNAAEAIQPAAMAMASDINP